MIVGSVNARFEMVVRLAVRGPAGQEQEIDAILDTGFSGSLTLPPALIAALGCPWRSRSSATLANGRTEEFDVHVGTAVWDGVPRRILIQAVDGVPLLGMVLLSGYDLRARVLVGGAIQVDPIPLP